MREGRKRRKRLDRDVNVAAAQLQIGYAAERKHPNEDAMSRLFRKELRDRVVVTIRIRDKESNGPEKLLLGWSTEHAAYR